MRKFKEVSETFLNKNNELTNKYLVISLVGSQKKRNEYDCGMFMIKYTDKQNVIKFQL